MAKINKTLAFIFQVELIATKRFRDAGDVFARIRGEYLNSKFGDDIDLHFLVLTAIDTGNRNFALDINKALVVLGKNEFLEVLFRLIDKYPSFCYEHYISDKFASLLRRKKSFGLAPGKYYSGNRVFGVHTIYKAYYQAFMIMHTYDSVESLIASGHLSEENVRSALKAT